MDSEKPRTCKYRSLLRRGPCGKCQENVGGKGGSKTLTDSPMLDESWVEKRALVTMKAVLGSSRLNLRILPPRPPRPLREHPSPTVPKAISHTRLH